MKLIFKSAVSRHLLGVWLRSPTPTRSLESAGLQVRPCNLYLRCVQHAWAWTARAWAFSKARRLRTRDTLESLVTFREKQGDDAVSTFTSETHGGYKIMRMSRVWSMPPLLNKVCLIRYKSENWCGNMQAI